MPLVARIDTPVLRSGLVFAAALLAACAPAAPTQLEIFSSWTTGPEAVGLEKLGELFQTDHPDLVVVNAALGGDETLRDRMLAGAPPDGFQAQMGEGFNSSWVASGAMEPLDDVYETYGFSDAFHPGILELVSYEEQPYSVPVNIHRANVLWYNKAVFEANGINPASLSTFEGWWAAAETLRGAGVTPLALGDKTPWAAAHLFETVLIGTLGAEAYTGLWTGDTDWNGPEVSRALENFALLLSYANPDHATLTWDQANQLVLEGKAAMTIMGDWIHSDYVAKGFSGYGWAPPPGNAGIFDALSDSFGLPENSPHPQLMKEFLGVLGSREGQETFNRLAGSLCARTDCNYSDFDAYLQSSAAALKTAAIVPSLVHGAAASEGWTNPVVDTVAAFVTSGDITAAQAGLARACVAAGVCH